MDLSSELDLHTPLVPSKEAPPPDMAAAYATAAPAAYPQHDHHHKTFWAKVMQWDAPTLVRVLRYVNVVLAILQAIAGFLGLFDLVTLDITSFLISLYAIIFALLFLSFECRFHSMEPFIRERFGFLFTYRGRAIFILCVGFMDFGIDTSLGFMCGCLMCGNALFNSFVMHCHPEFRNGHLTAQMDPTAAYAGASEEASQLLRQNPELASKASAFVVQQAQQNPQMAADLARAAYNNSAYNYNNGAQSPAGSYVPPMPTTPTHQ